MDRITQLSRLGLFDAKVPRYTSYPPATRFGPAVDSAVAADWASAIRPGTAISLYVHVPFCRRLCWFCACRTQGTSTGEPVAAYVETVKAEIAHLAAVLPEGVQVSRLHWGGGTPTLMTPAQMADLSQAILGQFTLSPGAEFSVEIDPNEIDEARLDALAAAGMNRASIGVQDFHPDIQRVIGREQSYEVTRAAVEGIRARGIASLNADILFGLPHQNRARMVDSVSMLLSLSPDRVALYGYAHVPWMARRQGMIPSDSLPRPEERLELFEAARKLFVWDGYDEIGIDHFARPEDGLARAAREGRLRRNFQGYTDDTAQTLIGLGASAISRYPQGYAQNASATGDYTKRVRAGELATHRGHAFSAEDLLRGRMIEALMCDFRIDTAELVRDFGAERADVGRMFREAAEAFPGMVRVAETGLEVPPEARPLTRMIARAFDAYEMAPAGHSSAI
ncbi:MAG: oxygen-independent coproporphyrinogen III oxidase [Rhodobacteraceae bacterium]|jgi:oxygen-independent coproporphyrinogen-3 oxidase|nr:oxygen-independent coproporphyrinogen III oxidase [Paracoccaceae bacterium]